MQEALRGLDTAIAAPGGVLLCGEPGSGRELFARAIHRATWKAFPGTLEALLRLSMRQAPNGRPFVSIDCANRDGFEGRLFGTELAGAGDDVERIAEGSLLHASLGGTLVLRQAPEMPARLQVRLARILRDGEVRLTRAGGETSVVEVPLRPMATADRVGGRSLVPDLMERLSRTVIDVPPLRSRRDDMPGLVRCLLTDLCALAEVEPKTASRQAIDLLTALPWRGNVRELEGLLRALVSKVPGRQIKLSDVLARVRLDGQPATASYSGTLKEAREQFEREYVAAVLDRHRGRMSEAARALGLQRTNLYRKVRQLSVQRGSTGRRLS
jgi:DNA-binding NtrC family response regulator